ncbi:uncharacterized protein LOC111245131 isoform X2 [Varroa destructor]|uniref:CB1 cannabinoid receptor-interacting protein 1 n=1 Tax=Varroa destructor TaxID=109461 RepID=A0A7M7JAP1_VARDE|nr:uncharacterized protein LOC111245131 isoform X2 [Varroa destructor]
MAGGGKTLKIQLMLEKCTEGHESNGTPTPADNNESGKSRKEVFYKGDGARFDLDTTIKFNINGTYELSIIFRPVVRIERMEIMGDVKTPSEKSRDLESVTYVAYFDTKAKQNSKNGKRDKIHIFLDLGEYGPLNFDLQAKYYREKDNHAVWGNQLHHIDLEAFCSGGEVKISKMLFW